MRTRKCSKCNFPFMDQSLGQTAEKRNGHFGHSLLKYRSVSPSSQPFFIKRKTNNFVFKLNIYCIYTHTHTYTCSSSKSHLILLDQLDYFLLNIPANCSSLHKIIFSLFHLRKEGKRMKSLESSYIQSCTDVAQKAEMILSSWQKLEQGFCYSNFLLITLFKTQLHEGWKNRSSSQNVQLSIQKEIQLAPAGRCYSSKAMHAGRFN